ncbi:MAG: DUF5677 domain-containing protein [Actinomycetota bacterium]|nr:DUF5677 domain-containing protein [Actinomycetota bacterium]
MRARDQRIQRRGRALVALVTRRLPQEFDITGDEDAWPGVGVGLLSRMTTTLGSILDLQPAQREADAGTLLRSLFEHAVHFAWLAAEPTGPRLKLWREHDELMGARAAADAHNHGIDLTDAEPAQIKTRLSELRGKELKLEQLAVAADKYWGGRLPGMQSHGEAVSFRGLYAILYRHFSGGMAHPSRRGLNRVYDELGPTRRRIRLEGEYQSNGPYSVAMFVFGITLFASGQTIGWPSADEVNAVFARNPV